VVEVPVAPAEVQRIPALREALRLREDDGGGVFLRGACRMRGAEAAGGAGHAVGPVSPERRETQEVVVSLYGRKAEVALGTISALERRTSEALNPAYDGAIEAVRQSKSAGLDETGWPEAKGKGWLWAAVTNAISAFHVDRNRNAEAFHRLMGPKYQGTIGTDRWSSYHGHPNTRRESAGAPET